MEENKNNDNKLESIKTYMSDMADVVRDEEISIAKIASAEQKERERGDYYKKGIDSSKNKLFYILGGIIFIIGTIFISYLLIQKNKKDNVIPIIIKVKESPISYENKVSIDITNASNETDLSRLIDVELFKKGDTESIKEIVLTKKSNEVETSSTVNDFLSLLNTTAPSSLIRSFSGDYMLGVYTPPINYNKTSLFLIIKIKNYNLAYSGMLEWEKTIIDNLFSVFHIDISGNNIELFQKSFKDIIIKNKDARVLYNSSGVDALFYLFTDKNTLVISDSKNAIKEIITRMLIKQTKPI